MKTGSPPNQPEAGMAISSTAIPARLDRLPWSRFHWLVTAGLGATWILDGLEVTLAGSLSVAIQQSPALGMSPAGFGLTASGYLAGAVLGALLFGYLTDTFGRKRLFTVTVGLYMTATLLTALSWDFWSFALFRFLTGAGIGGEYAAINSAVQEFTPARRRGVTDLIVNGSFWLGAAVGALGSAAVLNTSLFPPDIGWRFAFAIGGLLALGIIYLRHFLPESPRWLMTHGRLEEAEAIVAGIEASVAAEKGSPQEQLPPLATIRLAPARRLRLVEVAHTLLRRYPRRTVLAVVLMATQAFCYNAIFFTYALILTKFYGVQPSATAWFILPFALGNFAGPLLLGHLFDSIGRKPMIALTYAVSGALVIVAGYLFWAGLLDATYNTALWTVIFFFASAGASAAYLTAGESFPLEMRAMAIALFYAFGTGIGGVAAPALFGMLIETGSRGEIWGGYLLAGGLMLGAALTEAVLGVAAERRSLEDVAPPLSLAEE
jgi:MFS family permease